MNTITFKQARIELMGLTQSELSRLLGVSRRTLCRYEKSGAPPQALLLMNQLVMRQQKRPARSRCA